MESLGLPKRWFEKLSPALHEGLPLSIANVSRSRSSVFDACFYDRTDKRLVVVEFKAAESYDIGYPCGDFCDSMAVYVVLSAMNGRSQKDALPSSAQRIQLSIPDNFEELCEEYLSECKNLHCVTFGESSSLKRIGNGAFWGSGLREVHIPDSVEELCTKCFYECENLSRVTFGMSSSLKLIASEAFYRTLLTEIDIPDGVEELCEKCFFGCMSLSRVTFGESSSLKRIGNRAFVRALLTEIHIPNNVEELCKKCFCACESLSRVVFSETSSLKRIGKQAFFCLA